MKLEFLATGSPDCPLIRLYDFPPMEAGGLRDAVARLASGAVESVEVDQLPGVESVGGCRLTLKCTARDQAIVRKDGAAAFECRFTAGTWDNVAGLIEPFAEGRTGMHWLAGIPGAVALLLSDRGAW